jgi:hypothetical protein
MIKWIRYRCKIPVAKLRHPEELTVQQVAEPRSQSECDLLLDRARCDSGPPPPARRIGSQSVKQMSRNYGTGCRKFNRLRHATAGFTTSDGMDTGFAIICPLARHRRPPIRFLFISSRLCSTLLSGPASRRVLFHLCASLTLHPPAGWVEELHLLAVEHARHAKVKPGFLRSSPSLPRRFAYLWG